jgi:hypothetical protein
MARRTGKCKAHRRGRVPLEITDNPVGFIAVTRTCGLLRKDVLLVKPQYGDVATCP